MRVLLVDDESDLASALAERLDMRGIDADWVSSGQEALALAAQSRFERGGVVFVERCGIGFKTAVVHAGQFLHAFWHALITNAELSNGVIDVLKKGIDDLLRNLLSATI